MFGAVVLLFWFDGPMLRTKAENDHSDDADGASSPNGAYDELASASKIAVNNLVHESSSSGGHEKGSRHHDADSSSTEDDDADGGVIVEHAESSSSDVVLSKRDESTSPRHAHV